VDCADFASHKEAHREFAKDSTDPNKLDDDDDDGITCEDLIGEGREDPTPVRDQYAPEGDVSNPRHVIPGTSVRRVPFTGGGPYLAMGALALLGMGRLEAVAYCLFPLRIGPGCVGCSVRKMGAQDPKNFARDTARDLSALEASSRRLR